MSLRECPRRSSRRRRTPRRSHPHRAPPKARDGWRSCGRAWPTRPRRAGRSRPSRHRRPDRRTRHEPRLPYLDFADAVGSLAEACTLIRRLWTEDEPFDFDGTYHQLTGAFCNPKPVQRPHPPVMIGGRATATLRVVAEHADLWNIPGADLDDCSWTSSAPRSVARPPRSPARSICGSPTTDPRSPETRSRELSTRASRTSCSGSPLHIPKASGSGSPASSSPHRPEPRAPPRVRLVLRRGAAQLVRVLDLRLTEVLRVV
jgi:alkanesulfonate monooxygenase SsuD/methylene tetrahydromethanopterin reductase-like flavin-dependent oxidoreductase (luciferase family)